MNIITQSEFNHKLNTSFDLLHKSYHFKNYLNYLEKKININKSIFSIIMDQRYVPGAGKYIKSKRLYLSKIHP